MEAGKYLRKLREAKEIGIKTAAKKLEVDYTHLSKIENGKRSINPVLVEKLASLYGIDKEELIAKMCKLPPDIELILEQHGKEVFDILRQKYSSE